MELFSFVATIILVTGSGALAPGPLFFENLSQGARSGAKSGLVFSLAHTLVEFTLVMMLALGLLAFASDLVVKHVIGVVGGAVLIAYGAMQIRGSVASKFGESKQVKASSGRLFLLGLALTGLNPFFIVWWLTAGAATHHHSPRVRLVCRRSTNVLVPRVDGLCLAHGYCALRQGGTELCGTKVVQTSHGNVWSGLGLFRIQLHPQLSVTARLTLL